MVYKLQVVLACLLAAIVYGIVHDQITARVCVEYFTVAHPPLFPTRSPTLLGLAWGVVATWWIGLILGVLLARAASSRGQLPTPIASLCKQILILLGAMAIAALCAGLTGFELCRRSIVPLSEPWASVLPDSRHAQFLAVWCAHLASYVVGVCGAALLIYRVWKKRGHSDEHLAH